MPAAMQPLAVEIEDEVAFGERLVCIAFRRPGPAVPDHDGPAAILAFRDGALEAVVLDRMILDLHGKPLFAGIEAWSAGAGPALHNAIEFQPQIVMQPSRRVLLNDIAVPPGRPLAPARFRCHTELPFLAI